MSRVTNLIIATGLGEDISSLQEKFKNYESNGVPFNISWIDDEFLSKGWYGGSKLMEANIMLGAYNYLELEELISFMRHKIEWADPEQVQLIVKEQNDLRFRIIDIFPMSS